MINTYEELRIIVQDADARLSMVDRQIIARAAEELELLQRQLILTNAALIESQQRQIATNEQLSAARKLAPKPNDPIWIKLYSGPLMMREFKL